MQTTRHHDLIFILDLEIRRKRIQTLSLPNIQVKTSAAQRTHNSKKPMERHSSPKIVRVPLLHNLSVFNYPREPLFDEHCRFGGDAVVLLVAGYAQKP